MGQKCVKPFTNCELPCLKDDSQQKSDIIDSQLKEEKKYYKRQVSNHFEKKLIYSYRVRNSI